MNFLFAIGMLLASYAITALMMPTQAPQKPATLDEFDFPQVDEGTPQSVIFGDVWIMDWIVLWYGNLRTSAIKSDSGKK